MAAPRPTYAFIPPPPLPEFYLPQSRLPAKDNDQLVLVKTKNKKQAKPPQTSNHGTSHHAADTSDLTPPHHIRTTITRETKEEITYRPKHHSISAPLVVVPGERMPGHESNVPPLAVYHICRVCLRPRSSRYHRDHPIPINGVPPPPGICRRCRVTPAEDKEKNKVDVVLEGQSNEVKLGLRAFVPEDDFISNEEGRERRGRAIMRSLDHRRDRDVVQQDESTKTGTERELVYRHVKVRETSLSQSPAPLPNPKTGSTTTAQDAIAAAKQKLHEPPPPPSPPPAVTELTKATAVKAFGKSNLPTTVARIEVETSASAFSRLTQAIESLAEKASKPERPESEIRHIARQEVERYRQAERLMAAHPNAYARGHLVPVERRIAVEVDIPQVPSWHSQKGVDETSITHEREYVDALPAPPPPMREERALYEDREVVEYAESDHGKSEHRVDKSTLHATYSAHGDHSTAHSESRSPTRTQSSVPCYEERFWGPRWLRESEAPQTAKTASVQSDKTRWLADQRSAHHETRAMQLLHEPSAGHQQDVKIPSPPPPSSRPRSVLVESESKHIHRPSQAPSMSRSGNPWDMLSDMQTSNRDYSERQRSEHAPSQAQQASIVPTKEQSDKPSRREYVYTVRTTEPDSKRADRDTRGGKERYFSITREHIRRLNEATGADVSSNQGPQSPQEVRAGTSEYGSSRVRFATKVEISPAAPGSDASSSQFRQLGPGGRGGLAYDGQGIKRGSSQLDGQDEIPATHELEHDEGRRGRTLARDREHGQGEPYYRKTKVMESRKYERQWDAEPEEMLRQRRESVDSVPMSRGYLNGALSESPSRERLEEMVKRPNSTDVEDGSNAPRHWAGNGRCGREADAGRRPKQH